MSDTIRQIDYSVNLLKALIWQENEATNLTALLEAKQTWYNNNQESFWSNWYTNVFNLPTANEFGCVVWAIILGLPLNLFVTPSNPLQPFGFDVYNPTNWDGLSNYTSSGGSSISFTLAEQRTILQLRYRQLTNRPTIPAINRILADLMVPLYGECYCVDNYNMTDKIVFPAGIPYNANIIIMQLDLIPRPACVTRTVTTS